MKCSACGKEVTGRVDGIDIWDLWYCSECFIGQARGLHRELRPEDLEMLRNFAREMAGLLPPDLVRMILVGFWRRASGGTTPPPEEELERTIGEVQRITALSCFKQVLNLLKTWSDTFSEFVRSQEDEIREKVKRLTDAL
ncbi:MAG: hypothetical protein ACREDF_00030 [Thermoplasmata archaeon]